jgi:ABC-type lipoprotein release transport system permease subunit
MALGAERRRIANLVLRSGAKLALWGVVFGTAGSIAASGFIRSYLFEEQSTDPWLYLVGAFVLMAIACVASLLPALRAASGEPVQALRAGS